jgi:hypothetical protein
MRLAPKRLMNSELGMINQQLPTTRQTEAAATRHVASAILASPIDLAALTNRITHAGRGTWPDYESQNVSRWRQAARPGNKIPVNLLPPTVDLVRLRAVDWLLVSSLNPRLPQDRHT